MLSEEQNLGMMVEDFFQKGFDYCQLKGYDVEQVFYNAIDTFASKSHVPADGSNTTASSSSSSERVMVRVTDANRVLSRVSSSIFDPALKDTMQM
jgi:hypothetical protein